MEWDWKSGGKAIDKQTRCLVKHMRSVMEWDWNGLEWIRYQMSLALMECREHSQAFMGGRCGLGNVVGVFEVVEAGRFSGIFWNGQRTSKMHRERALRFVGMRWIMDDYGGLV